MCYFLETGYAKLSREGKKKVEEKVSNVSNIRFRGFDANNEENFGIAKYLVKHIGFDHFTPPAFPPLPRA